MSKTNNNLGILYLIFNNFYIYIFYNLKFNYFSMHNIKTMFTNLLRGWGMRTYFWGGVSSLKSEVEIIIYLYFKIITSIIK